MANRTTAGNSGATHDAELAASTLFYCFVMFLLAAPLHRGGDAPLPLLFLESAAIVLIAVLVALRRVHLNMPRTLLAALAILIAYPMFQRIPLPDALWRLLPGHDAYAEVIDRFAAGEASALNRTVSIIPAATEYGWLAMLPPLACFLVVLHLHHSQSRSLVLWMTALAGCEALLGLLQAAVGGDSLFHISNKEVQQPVLGTFANRNHLAAMLAMMLPVAVGWLAFTVRRQRHLHKSGLAKSASGKTLLQRVLVSCAVALMLACLALTRSRAGIAAALIGLACSSIVVARISTGARGAKVMPWLLIGMGTFLAVAIGLGPFLGHFESREATVAQDGRGGILEPAILAAVEFLPFGSGLSTFSGVFPRYQVGDLAGHIDSAHSDYLQAFIELGLVAPVVVALMLTAYATRMAELLRTEKGRSLTLLQIAAGIGILTIVLQSAFDSVLRVPAIAMWVAALTGLLFHVGVGPRDHGIDEAGERDPALRRSETAFAASAGSAARSFADNNRSP